MSSELELKEHFAFGENWQSFATTLDDDRVAEAEAGMRRLFPDGELIGARFLDIGCGSGLSSLAAARLGVREIEAIDIDPNSVAATKSTLSRFSPGANWSARVQSVFSLSPQTDGMFDVVYSWGVLHHTGDMWRAVRTAAAVVKPGGYFAIALYRRTPLCGFWVREKKFYSNASKLVQTALRAFYKCIWLLIELRRGRNPSVTIRNYRTHRGMNWTHDVHDWLGGYPYESAPPDDIRSFLRENGFTVVREFLKPPGRGFLGSGCDEFVAVRSVER